MPKPDYILDLSSLARSTTDAAQSDDSSGSQSGSVPVEHADASLRGRPWLAIHWKCCSVYSRIYRQAEVPMYEGRCPRCARPLKIAVGEGGTNSRFFEAR